MLRVLRSWTRAALPPTRFFPADAENVPPISLTAPAQDGEGCQSTIASGARPAGTRFPIGGAWAAFMSLPRSLAGAIRPGQGQERDSEDDDDE